MISQKFIDDHKKSYKCANLVLEGNTIRLVNKFTGALHPFDGGVEEIKLSARELKTLRL